MSTMDERMDAYERTARQMIDEHGWMLQGVFPTQAEPGPDFVYTVGLTKWNWHPEIIVFGLPHRVGGNLLNQLGAQVRDGRRYAAGEVLDDLLVDYPAHLVAVADTAEHFGMARRLYGPDITALQLVWPDQDGRFPWEQGFALADLEPLLGLPT